MTAANATVASISRADFEELANRMAVLERSRGPMPATHGEEFVRQAEFRLFKWFAASFGELQVGMEREVGGLRERLVRIETQLDGVLGRLDEVESRLDGVEKRLERVPD